MNKNKKVLYLVIIYTFIVLGYRFFFASSLHDWQLNILGYAYIPLLVFNLLVPSTLPFLILNKTGISWTGGFSKKMLKSGLIAGFIGFLIIAIGFDICISNGYNDRAWPGGLIITSFCFLAVIIVHFILRKIEPILKEGTLKKRIIVSCFFCFGNFDHWWFV